MIIGATAKSLQDFHPVAMSGSERMPGVEVHANAIASLMTNQTIGIAIKNPILNVFLC